MDTKQPTDDSPLASGDPDLEALAAADPADAPEIAETLAAVLSADLDDAGADR